MDKKFKRRILLNMRTILKKNQVILSVIAVMLIAAGYMNYTANSKDTLQTSGLMDSEKYGKLGDATFVSANVVEETNKESEENSKNQEAENTENAEIKGEKDGTAETNSIENTENITKEATVQTSAKESDQYFTESKLSREKMYSQMLESYQKILQNNNITDTQKEISQNEIKKINDTKNAIMITENLIKNKGFEDVLIFVNGDSISVVIKAEDLNKEQIAQIQNIVSRELKAEIENVHISKK